MDFTKEEKLIINNFLGASKERELVYGDWNLLYECIDKLENLKIIVTISTNLVIISSIINNRTTASNPFAGNKYEAVYKTIINYIKNNINYEYN